MSEHHHDDDDHHHHEPEHPLSIRVRALESLLVEKGLMSSDVVDRVVSLYEKDIGPHNGAKVVARAWVDPAYKARLLADGSAAIEELGFGGVDLRVVENTPAAHNLVTCTMCSPCGPPKPSSAMAAVPSAKRRARYAGSTQARATTLAPFSGPMSCS